MIRTRKNVRRTCRRPTIRAWRPIVHAAIRALPGHRRGPNDLSQALAAFARANRCHRRLAKLAPAFFDSAAVDRDAREREERRQLMAWLKPAIDRVYGPSRDDEPAKDSASSDLPPLPKPLTQRAVEHELVAWDFWMAAGRLALARHQHRRPHVLPSLTQVTRMLRIAADLGHLVCGLEKRQTTLPAPS